MTDRGRSIARGADGCSYRTPLPRGTGRGRSATPRHAATRPPEQLKAEAERPGNPDSSPGLAWADAGSDPDGIRRRE